MGDGIRAMNIQGLLRKRNRGKLLAVLTVAAFALSAALIVRAYFASKPPALTISAGNTEGIWHQFLLTLAREVPANRLRVTPVVTAGSLDMLERVDRGALDFALIQGGFDIARFRNVRQVAGLTVIPLHFLVKDEIHAAVIADPCALRGKRVNLGSGKRTGTYWLSREILAFAGLSPEDYRPTALTIDQLWNERDRGRLPDAVFIVTNAASPLVRHLVVEHRFRLVPIPFGDAFRLGALDWRAAAPPGGMVVRKEHIPDAVIPAFAYQVSPAVPPGNLDTLGSRLLLITHRRIPDATVVRLLEALLESRFAKAVNPPLDTSIVRLPPEAPWHPGALEFRDRGQPLITSEVIGVLSNALQILLPTGGGLLCLWGWMRNRMLDRRARCFDQFLALVTAIERRGLALERGGALDHKTIRHLQRELSMLKDEALQYVSGRETSVEGFSTSLLGHISDVRAYLTELERHASDPDTAEAKPRHDAPADERTEEPSLSNNAIGERV